MNIFIIITYFSLQGSNVKDQPFGHMKFHVLTTDIFFLVFVCFFLKTHMWTRTTSTTGVVKNAVTSNWTKFSQKSLILISWLFQNTFSDLERSRIRIQDICASIHYYPRPKQGISTIFSNVEIRRQNTKGEDSNAEHCLSKTFIYPFTSSTKMSQYLLAQSLSSYSKHCICSTSLKFTCNLIQNTAYPEDSLTYLHGQQRWVIAIYIH